jgi:taurine dioxygenase
MLFEALSPAIGARVTGIDLCAGIDDAARDALLQGLHTHHVLFFEDQPLTPAQHRDLAAHFGKLHIHPVYPTVPEVPEIIVLDTGHHNPPDSDTWHTDVTFIETPPMGALLSARVLPPQGGDTLWLSCIAAFDALSAPMRDFLRGLSAVHDIAAAFTDEDYGGTDEARQRLAEARLKNPPVVHPVVRTHPVTGRQGIFVNASFTTRICELSKTESAAVLQFLAAHVAKPEFTVRWRWKPFDLAFWDNRLTQHYATADYVPHRRVMHRATILGDRPR